jgi:hypothetical protein
MNIKEMKLAEKLANADYHDYESEEYIPLEEEQEQEQKDGGN